jgi:hypothetical protein
MYKLYKNAMTNEVVGAIKQTNSDVICFLFNDPTNTDYAAYLQWLSEGNEPLPAPEPEPAPVLTTEQKLEAAGLTVAELKELFGLT